MDDGGFYKINIESFDSPKFNYLFSLSEGFYQKQTDDAILFIDN